MTRFVSLSRLRIAVLVAIVAHLIAAPAQGASGTDTRTFRALGSSERSFTFRLVGVESASVRRAHLASGGRRVAVPVATARRGARRGVLRLPRSILATDRRPTRNRAARPAMLVLTVAALREDASPGGGHARGRPPAIEDAPAPVGSGSGAHAPSPHVSGATADPPNGRANALAGMTLHVEADSRASLQADAWRSSRPLDAAQMDRIAAQPQARWFGEWSGDIRSAVSGPVDVAATAGAVPILVAYNIPQRDCGSHSAGGAVSSSAYRTWIREFAAAIGARPAIVVLEPDALAGMDCLGSEDRATRLALLEDAVSVLSSRQSVATYVDAGHSAWQPADVMAARLRSVGISRAQGFSLNVSNFRPTGEAIAYGRVLAELIGGKHFVIDTSRNGPAAASQEWCNPEGRALGSAPTPDTGQAMVDAYLWIKRPGESDGTCNSGPAAGAWWPEYALGLAQRAM